MKNRIKQYLLAASMCVGLTACSDFFEPIPGVQFGLDETFASKQRTEEYLNNVYSYVREVTDAIHPNTYGGYGSIVGRSKPLEQNVCGMDQRLL